MEKDAPGLSATSTTSESLESNGLDTEIPAAARKPRSTRGSQKWSNVRAVMALYSSLRKIKRYSRHCSIWTVTSELHSHPSLCKLVLHATTHSDTCTLLYIHDGIQWLTQVFEHLPWNFFYMLDCVMCS